jgi:hypothetical protein
MAYKIESRTVFANYLNGTGGTALSDAIDLRDIYSPGGAMALSFKILGTGGAATCSTTNFTYLCGQGIEGTFYQQAGTFGTIGTSSAVSGQNDWIAFTPPTTPFIKIKAVTGTNNACLITAQLHVR